MRNKYLLYILLFFNSIMVIKAQSNCNPSVNINFTGLCAGKSDLLIASPTNGGLTPFYTWKRNNVIIPIFNNKTTDNGIGANSINEVIVIGSNIYAATMSGLSISTNAGSSFSNKTKNANGLGNDAVNGLFVSNTKIYAATSTGLSISEDNGNTFTNRTNTNGLGSNIVNDVFVDATGEKVYAATNSGLSVSTNSGASFTNKSIGNVRGLFVDGLNIYAATGSGLLVSTDGGVNFNGKTITSGLGSNIINDVIKVGNILFVATAGGLSISSDNGNTFSNKTTTNGLADNNISSVFAIGSFIYASTNNGLSLSNDNGNSFFISETTADGLGTNTINGAFAVGNNIYAATTGGLAIATIDRIQVNNVIANDVYSVTMLPSIDVCPTPNPVSKSLTIYPLPIPNITTNSPVCTAMPLTLNASNVRVSTGNSYAWTGPNAYVSTNQNPSFSNATIDLSGTYSITITDVNGCTATATTAAIVNPLPIPSVANNSPICTAFTLNLTATNTRNAVGNSYAWTGPNAYTSINQNPSLPNATVELSGTYSVTITDLNGCTATATTAAVVNPLPIPKVNSNSPICTAFTLDLTATNERNAVGNNYSWTGPNAYTSTNQNPSRPNAIVDFSGIYSVTITDLNGCTATATTAAIINPLPIPKVNSNSPICTAFTLNITATNTRNAIGNSYAWTGPNAYVSTNQSPSLPNATVDLSGTYSVTITDVNGCTATATTAAIVNPLPIPSVSNNSPICTAFTLNLTAINTRNAVGNSYAWTGPNAYVSTNQSPSLPNATVELSGTYSVTITDVNGCTATATTAAVVNPLPIPKVNSNSPICTAFTLDLTATNERTAVGNNYSWTGPNAYTSTNQNPSRPNATVDFSGIYSVTITDLNGCTATATTAAIINPLPIPSVSNNSPICTAFTLNLTATNTRNAVGNSYAWTGPNSYVSTNQNPSLPNATVELSGTYSVTITDVNGCTATATTAAIVNPLPIPSVSNNSPICTAFTLNLTATNTRNAVGNSYAWTGPNAYVSTNQSPSLPNATVDLSGTYSVTITDVNGCTATATTAAIVNPLPIPSISNNSPICTAFTLNLTATNTRSSVGNSYAWTGPNAYVSTNQSPSLPNATVELSGTYSVTITDVNGCTATATTAAIVNPLPIPSVSNNSPICTAFTLNLTSTNTRNAIGNSYAWTGPNAYVSTNQSPSLPNATVELSGTYSVTITDVNGCTATATTAAIVNPLPIPSVSNNSPICTAFTLNLTATNTRSSVGNSYAWTGPNAYVSTNQSPSLPNATVELSGTYSVTITDVNGCTATATTAAIVNPLPIPSVSNNSPICTAFTLSLSATNTRNETGNAYVWTGPNAYTSTNQNPSFTNATVALSGVYSVTITDLNGCTATASTSVIVKPKPPVPVISVPNQLIVCFPNTLTLTASGCAGSITWSDNSTGSTITLSSIGIYSLSAICTLDGCVSERSQMISGLEVKVAPTAQASNDGPYVIGQAIKLNASNGPNYSWTGPNNFTSLVSSPTISSATLQNSGIYNVTVSINGCTATATTNVVVNNFAPCSPQRIVDYSYVKAGNPHQPLFPLSNGMILQQIPEESSIFVTPVCPTINIESFEMKIVGPELNYLTVQNASYFALFDNNGEDVFGRNFIPGDYTLTVTGYSQDNKNGVIVYGPVITTFKVVGTLGMISVPTLSSQSICAGSSVDVSFTTSGNFNQVSQFQVQLSDASGSFQNPITIGTSNTTGTVSCFIPTNIAEGTNYLIRVASSNQLAVGNPTMSFVSVNPVNSSISQNISTGTVTNKATQSLSANNKIIAPAQVNYQAGKAISLNAGFEAGNGSVFKAEIKGCN